MDIEAVPTVPTVPTGGAWRSWQNGQSQQCVKHRQHGQHGQHELHELHELHKRCRPYRILASALLALLTSNAPPLTADTIGFDVPTGRIEQPIRSWKNLRDARLVRQALDISCGAASLATILQEFYGQPVTEAELLVAMDKSDQRASFADMARILPQYGLQGVGLAVAYPALTELRIPVVVHLQHRLDDHFAVLRGISTETVWLADPASGNRTYSTAQFRRLWETRQDPHFQGRILAILPAAGAPPHASAANPSSSVAATPAYTATAGSPASTATATATATTLAPLPDNFFENAPMRQTAKARVWIATP